MPIIESQIEVHSDEFSANVEAMQTSMQMVQDIEDKVYQTEVSKKERYAQRKMILPRERLARLLDPGAPFLELASLAGYKMYDDNDGTGAGAASISGIGYVSGVRCMVRVDNYAVKGGTITPIGLEKALRMQHIAFENKLPTVALAQSGGANLTYAADTFAHGGRGFANQARTSAAGIPQITVVHGSATAGGAYQPGLSDYTIMIRNQATMYLAGPPLLKAATGEIATDEVLGGAEMHTSLAGTAEYLAEDDADGIRIAREILATLPWDQQVTKTPVLEFEEPLHSQEELLGVVPYDTKKPYDVREIIARISDASNFLDFKIEYDQQTVCGHMWVEGHTVGLIGNNGPITANGATKAAQFIQLCEQSNIPILFLHNTTGFMVGTESEQAGIIKHGSKLIQAVACATVPKISIVVGGSYGAGNYAMCGRGFDPTFIFAWPNSKTMVMGGAQAGQVLRIVAEAKMKKMGQVDETTLDSIEKQTTDMLDAQSTALACTARLWDDGIIDPRDTRKILAYTLDICREAAARPLRKNTFGVARL